MYLAFAIMLGSCATNMGWLAAPAFSAFALLGSTPIGLACTGGLFVVYGDLQAYTLAAMALTVACPRSVLCVALAPVIAGWSGYAARSSVLAFVAAFKIAGSDNDGPVHSAALRRTL